MVPYRLASAGLPWLAPDPCLSVYSFPMAGTDFGDGGEDVASGPMVKMAASDKWVPQPATTSTAAAGGTAPDDATNAMEDQTPNTSETGHHNSGSHDGGAEPDDGQPPAKRAARQSVDGGVS